jgi:hypothetical protein
MEVFFDNDVVIKLAQYGLLEPLLEIVYQCECKTFVLPTLRYVAGVGNPKRAARIFTSLDKLEAVERLINASEQAEINQATIAQLVSTISKPGLDPGELILIGCAAASSTSTGIVIGDKRAIQALNSITELTNLLSRCLIIMLEHVIKKLLSSIDESFVIEKINTNTAVDISIRICFSSARVDTIQQVFEALDSYIRAQEMNCQNLSFLK